jgi:tetratricopeptide (TPR) repeat protein
MRRLTAIVCIAATVATTVAYAEESPEDKRAKAIWRDGAKQYNLGDFEGAIQKFEEAYKVSPLPTILFNLGQAHRQKKNYERAVYYFRTYLREKPDAENRAVVEGLIVELQGLIAAQKASNERPPDTVTSPPAPPAGQATHATPVTPEEPRRWYQDTIGWTLAASGVVAIGLGTGFLIHSGGLSDDAKTAGDEQMAQDLHDSAKTFQIAGGITLGLGVALVTGGVVKMMLHERAPHESHVSLGIGPGTVVFAGQF